MFCDEMGASCLVNGVEFLADVDEFIERWSEEVCSLCMVKLEEFEYDEATFCSNKRKRF